MTVSSVQSVSLLLNEEDFYYQKYSKLVYLKTNNNEPQNDRM